MEHHYFVVYFESWSDKRNKVKVKISHDNIFIRGGNISIFNSIFNRDDVLDAIDYTKKSSSLLYRTTSNEI